MQQNYLDPSLLATISGLELIAKTVVDGYVAGLHRSPQFGFSQEFAEYRSYSEGDDLRHVDWNVYARTERAYLKRYKGETNSQITILFDASKSMTFGSHSVNKLDFARYLASTLAYMSNQQRDACGILVFDDEVRNFVPPSSRQGQFARLIHAIKSAEPGVRTDFSRPFTHCQNFLHRRGIIIVISDFYEDPEKIVSTMQPLRYHGSELIMFHVLDPQELRPVLDSPVMMVDMETGSEIEVSPEYMRQDYRLRIDGHIKALKEQAQRSGIDYHQLDSSQPLDAALREYLLVRGGRA